MMIFECTLINTQVGYSQHQLLYIEQSSIHTHFAHINMEHNVCSLKQMKEMGLEFVCAGGS
jgi:hypothetical protein